MFERPIRTIANLERTMNTESAVAELRPARGRVARIGWRDRGWLSTTEYADVTGTPKTTIKFWCARGWLKTVREGHDYRIPVGELYERYPHLRPAA